MSRNTSLDTQTYKHFVVIRKNIEIPLNILLDFLDENYDQYALIVHDKDYDKKTGIVVPIHYHYVGNLKKKRVRLQTTLNDLCKYLKFKDSHGIEIDKYKNIENSLQYLIHKNNPEKFQYEFDKIKYKGWTKDELTTLITSDCVGMNFDRVLSICQNYDSIIDVIREIGFTHYARYRSTIRDIHEFCLMIKRKERAQSLINDDKELPF